MKMNKNWMMRSAALLIAAGMLTGCGTQGTANTPVVETETETVAETMAAQTEAGGQVADASEMSEVVDVVEEGMEPVYADSLEDGVYDVKVDSSSAMFKIESCTLTVADGEMSAVMTMGGTGYLYLFMGTGEEAVKADESAYIPFEEDEEGVHSFTVPVEALDAAIDCTAFSKRKEKWYDRQILFRADSLPLEAFKEGYMTTVEDLELADGMYMIDVALEGGSGRASVNSPAKIMIADGQCTAEIIWSSKNYDYMLVDGIRYDVLTVDPASTFEIPVAGFDFPMAVTADTTAMSQPREIDYTLYFDAATIVPVEE